MSIETFGILLIFVLVFSSCYILLTLGLPRKSSFWSGSLALLLMLIPLYRPINSSLSGTIIRYALFDAVYFFWSLLFLRIIPRYALYLSSFCTIFMGVWYSCNRVLFYLLGFPNSLILTFTTGICRIVSVILLRRFLIQVSAERDITLHQLLLSLFPSLACFIANLTMFELIDREPSVNPFSAGLLVLFFGFAAMLVLISTEHYFSMEQLKKENSLFQSRLDSQYQRFLSEKQNDERARALQHDMQNHLNTLSRMLSSSESGKANAYISELQKAIQNTENEIHTGNATLDALLQTKEHMCDSKGIRLVNYLSVGSLDQLTPMEICTLFSNCIDNAIEALEKTSLADKVIRLSGGLSHGNIVIKIENPYEQPLSASGDQFLTTKKDRSFHGYGLKNVRQIVESHGGTLTFQTGHNIFCVLWMIPIKEQNH